MGATHKVTSTDIIPAQLIRVQAPMICGVTDTGHLIEVKTTAKQRRDPLFWRGLNKIEHEQLWLPISKSNHQLLEQDWLAVS